MFLIRSLILLIHNVHKYGTYKDIDICTSLSLEWPSHFAITYIMLSLSSNKYILSIKEVPLEAKQVETVKN